MIRNLFRLMFILIIISESLCSVTLLGICTYISANNISHCLQCSLSNKQPPLWLTTSHHHHVTITYHLYSFPPHCSWLEHSSWSGHQGLFLWSIQGYDSQITQYVSWSRPYHEEPLLSCFLLLSFVASLVCFCCSLHNTPSITWPVYYWLGVFNILKLSRNPEEEEWTPDKRDCEASKACQTLSVNDVSRFRVNLERIVD